MYSYYMITGLLNSSLLYRLSRERTKNEEIFLHHELLGQHIRGFHLI